MTSRILPPVEWPRLAGTEAAAVYPHLDPVRARVLVVEQEDRIVGCWVLMTVLHAECLWIADDHRKRGSVGRRLWTGMRTAAQALGYRTVATAATTDDVAQLLTHVGAQELPGRHYVLGV